MHKKWKPVFAGITIALSGFLFQIILQSVMHTYAKESFYFQDWSSETMMQTVSIKDLRDAPLETLYNIHIQPPALDLIRTILVYIWPAPEPLTYLKHVDYLLYQLWALLYGLLGLMVFLWTYKLTGMRVAIIAAVIFLLHPACIFYATLLDSTILTSLLILLMYYLLWKIKNNRDMSITAVTIAILALFFTRSIFQLSFVLVFGLSLFLLGISKRKVLLFLLITGGVIGLYIGKQYYQFGLNSTSSFSGLNLTNSVGIKTSDYLRYLDSNGNLSSQESALPNVLTRVKKIDGATNLNHIRYLELNQHLVDVYKEYIFATPVLHLIKSYLQNLWIYFKPSSRYTNHVIVDRIPWRFLYDRIFSFPILNALILLSGILWLARVAKRKDYIVSIGLTLPGLYIFLITVLFEKGENMRFKFFLEPVIFVFLVSQLYAAGQQVYQRVLKKRST